MTATETNVAVQTATDVKTDKPKRPEFDPNSAVDAAGAKIALEDGRMTAVPANWTNDFQPLGRGEFTTKQLFLEHRLGLAEKSVARAQSRCEDIKILIHEEIHGVDPVVQKQRRREKLMAELAELEKQLEADGATA